ncbi:MAG TPA: SDR family oxidoreductase [Lichenihabitans sp.]|jgi:NAD(P)-dependent dehydrogenase (short-subunit alcohol dehydrogenase family)|nr:SDR family oxidoreductase [Lichenihabitans sp.]
MVAKLKPLSDQTIVITGASSGIGLSSARRAAERGARVVLSSRNGPELEKIVEGIRGKGGRAAHVVADVSKREDLDRLAEEAIKAFGGFDTWVNNAGLGIFGRLDQVSDEDHHRLFEVNFWGLVYGTQIAAAHFRQKGGAIINLGSVVSDVAFPVQGMYCASKHAIKGFTDAFRMELEEAGAPVSVTLIKPASIDTPFPIHAKNYLDEEPTLPPPIYQPEDVADAILYAAQHGGRDYYVGGGGKLMSSLNKHIPSAIDWMATRMVGMESSGPPNRPREGSLHAVAADGRVNGDPKSMVRHSVYTNAQIHPLATAAMVAAGVAGLAFLARSSSRA